MGLLTRAFVLGTSRRFLATEAPAAATGGKLVLSLTVPHATLLKNMPVAQVNLSSTDGDMGLLAAHVPVVAQLKPGVIEILSLDGSAPKKFFASGGFAIMNPDSTLNINAVEAVALEDLDVEAAKKGVADADKVIASGASAEADKIAAKIQLEVFSAILAATK